MYGRVSRGGTVVDGSGGAPFVADGAIDGDRIVAVGENLGAGSENIDASGKIVTPGFVDVHTHYDGQATWDAEMAPSSWHGVTTVVMGNCGVGFAPAKPDRRSEEHTSELQSLMRISYAVFCLKTKTKKTYNKHNK